MRRSATGIGIGLFLVLSGCGGAGDSVASEPAATVTVTADASPSAPASATATPISQLRAGQVGRVLRQKLQGITDLTVITENNDPNDLIGRPGGYTGAAVLTDRSGDVSDQEPNVAWGATIEVFASPTEAQRRSDYIQSILQSTPALGTEYDYVSSNVLLRVSGSLKPSRAKRYETAFRSIPTG